MKTIDIWKKALLQVENEGYDYVDSDNRAAKELLNFIIKIEDPENQEVEEPLNIISDTNKWLYPTKTEISNVMFKELANPAYDYTYGGRIFNFSGQINQVKSFIIPLLQKEPESRRAVITIYNPFQDSTFKTKNVPAILNICLRLHQGKLALTAVIRSQDLFFGWPANIYQLYCLQKFISENLNVKMGSLTTISNSTHIFESNLSDIKKMMQ
jgi:thymidylate synthase (methanogen type)